MDTHFTHIAVNRGNWNINSKTLHEPAVYYNYALHYTTYLLKPHTPFFHSFPCTSAFKMHLTINAFLYITNLNWRNHWSVKTSLQLLLSSTPKKPCLFKTCFAHKRPIFLRRATEIKMKTLNQGGCFKRLRWFYFQSRILLASAMVSGTWCTECCQVPQLALWLPADTLTSFLGWCEHAASVHDGKEAVPARTVKLLLLCAASPTITKNK